MREIGLSIIILLHLWIIAFYIMLPNRFAELMLAPIRPAILFCGLWQNFAVFAPNPRKMNVALEAVVTLQDGSLQLYSYPRLERLNFWQKMQMERYRKYGHDHLNWNDHSGMWTDAARYIARLTYMGNEQNPPVEVALTRNWSDIPVPEKAAPIKRYPNHFVFFVYKVGAEDLR